MKEQSRGKIKAGNCRDPRKELLRYGMHQGDRDALAHQRTAMDFCPALSVSHYLADDALKEC